MNSRVSKYDNSSYSSMSRTKRNEEIYSNSDLSELSRIKTNNNVSVISDAKEHIDIDKIRRYIDSNEEGKNRRRVSLELPREQNVVVTRNEEKNYDVNSILERAKGNREIDYEENRHRKINNTQIDILKSIKIKEYEPEIDDDITGPIEELNTEEKTLVDLIQNFKSSNKTKDMFDDLMSDEDTMIAPIEELQNDSLKDNFKEELLNMTQDLESIKIPESEYTQEMSKVMEQIKLHQDEDDDEDYEDYEDDEDDDAPEIKEVDKSFFTSSINFDKSDFEGFDDLEKDAIKGNRLTKIAIIFVVVLLITTLLIIVNHIFDLNII